MVGGYVTQRDGEVKCWFGEAVWVMAQGEEYIEGLEAGLQFMLEEVNAMVEDITVIIDRKDIVGWLKNVDDTIWELIFIRNKADKQIQSKEAMGDKITSDG
ncbi:hypothetical protein PIB30_018573 [Stylosanthes scabra]|uniref:RNase H type-1 domain-containing protein n=1 Tax=Stylosanthes scabra TaxID=79078 RepID=A0ABU6R889_9FABA|nr:hypothetical protein [Stylosanthes scabra]